MYHLKQGFIHSVAFLAIILTSGLVAAGYLSYQAYRYLHHREFLAGQVAFDKAYAITREKLNSYVYGLQGMGGVYLTRNFAISPTQVREYAKFRSFFDNFPGAMGFGFIRYVPKKKMPGYQAQLQKIMPEFTITRLSPNSFGDYMIIESIEPIELNRSAQGLDVGSEQNRRAAATQAMETGLATLTRQVQLVQVDHQEPGFLYYLPLYKRHTVPPTLEERRSEIVGWAYAPILATAIGHHLRSSFDAGLEFAIYEVGPLQEQPQRIFGDLYEQKQTYSRDLLIGGAKWILKANFNSQAFPGYRWITPLMGFLLFSAVYSFICIYLRGLSLEKLETERRAKSIEDQMESLVNGASFAIIGVNPSGTITTVNKAAVEMLGYSRVELLSGVTPELFHDAGEMKTRAQALSAELGVPVSGGMEVFFTKARMGKVDTREWTYVRKDGSRFPVRLVITPIFSEEREIEGFLGIAEDITEVASMRETIEVQQQQMVASAKLSSLGEMAGGIAHEINNPLAIILSKIKLLEQKLSKEEIDWSVLKSEMGKISQTTLRIARIVRGLKAFSRESSQDPKEVVRVSSVIDDALDLCGEKFKYYKIDVRLKEFENIEISCRPTQITQVLVNLLGNSFDAIHDLAEKWIEVRVERQDSKLKLSVIDSGRGIPPEIAQKIMHPFFTSKEVGKGTGLGLSISKGIIEDHGGRLFLDASSPNTCFVVELPFS